MHTPRRSIVPPPAIRTSDRIETEGRWTVEDLEIQAAKFAEVPFQLGNPFGR